MNKRQIAAYGRNIRESTSRGSFKINRDVWDTGAFLAKDFLERLSQLPMESKVLEIGIGQGKTLEQLRCTFPHLKFYGTNYFKKKQTRSSKKSVVKAEASALPFKSNAFDLAFSVHTFQYVPDKAEFLREIHRVLKTGAQAAVHGALMNENFVVKRKKRTLIPREFLDGHIQLRVSDERDDLICVYKKTAQLHLPLKLNLRKSKADEKIKYTPHFISVYTETKKVI